MAESVGRDSDKFMLRFPDGMRDRIKATAENNNRSMNAEIISALDFWLEWKERPFLPDGNQHPATEEYYEIIREAVREALALYEQGRDERPRDK